MAASKNKRSAAVIAHNLRRIMAKERLSQGELVAAVGLDERTVRGVLRGENHTRTSTLNKLAEGLGVSVDELFHPPLGMTPQAFDAATNPTVDHAIANNPSLFENWGPSEFDELASRFGVGGSSPRKVCWKPLTR